MLCLVPACTRVSSHETIAPNGQRAWAITCSRRMSSCWDEAARRCVYGYDVFDQATGARVRVSSRSAEVQQTGEMLVVCH